MLNQPQQPLILPAQQSQTLADAVASMNAGPGAAPQAPGGQIVDMARQQMMQRRQPQQGPWQDMPPGGQQQPAHPEQWSPFGGLGNLQRLGGQFGSQFGHMFGGRG